MSTDLEQTLARELEAVAHGLVVPERPVLPTAPSPGVRRHATLLVAAAAAAVAVVAVTAVALTSGGSEEQDPAPPVTPTVVDDGPVSDAAPSIPVVVASRLYVGGQQVPGRWYDVQGRGTHWVGQRADGTWWWGYDAEPQRMDGAMQQPPVVSPSGGYEARVVEDGGRTLLIGADTEEGGEGFGGVRIDGSGSPPPRAIAVTDSGLVIGGGTGFQLLWRPLVDGATVDLADSAPGQVVLGGTAAGLLVNEGEPGRTDGTQGAPYLATLAEDGTLTPLVDVPTHDVLEASAQWLAYVPPGTVGGEASGVSELAVRHLDGTDAGVVTPPDGWLFAAPGFRWETDDRLLARVVTQDGGDEALVRCRPDPATCVLVDLG